MNRRSLLRGALGLAFAPALVRAAFASTDPEGQRAALSQAFRSAAVARRPLLVIVIPEASDKWARGTFWGELLNHGSDAQLARFARAEVVCATLQDLSRLVPGVTGEPWLVLVRTDLDDVAWRGLQLELPDDPPELVRDGSEWDDWDAWYAREKAWGLQRVQRRFEVFERDAGLAIDEAIGATPASRVPELAERARRMMVSAPPAGAHWAVSGGCGTTIEGVQDQSLMMCGMGHVPEHSRRMLYFFDVDGRGY